MNDLVEFLRARLTEDEKAARAAAETCGCHPAAPSWSFGDETTDGRILIVDDPHPGMRHKLSRRWNGTYQGLYAAQHIVRHDPARVLGEVEAKRRIIEEHKRVTKVRDPVDVWAGEIILATHSACLPCHTPTTRTTARSGDREAHRLRSGSANARHDRQPLQGVCAPAPSP